MFHQLQVGSMRITTESSVYAFIVFVDHYESFEGPIVDHHTGKEEDITWGRSGMVKIDSDFGPLCR